MMPGPLAAKLAMWIGFIRHGVLGASLVGVAFILPPYLIVVFIAAFYVKYNGLAVVQALFFCRCRCDRYSHLRSILEKARVCCASTGDLCHKRSATSVRDTNVTTATPPKMIRRGTSRSTVALASLYADMAIIAMTAGPIPSALQRRSPDRAWDNWEPSS
jgi:hypothetical protein